MAEVIRMPRMSDTMEEGNIIGWLKAEGETVEAGETLAEVETDKATMELDSYFDGVLLHIAVKEGPVAIDGVIAVIGKAGEDWQAAINSAKGSNGAAAEPAEEVASTPPAAPEPAKVVAGVAQEEENRMKASPLARNMAKEANVNLANLSGSGDNGRIVKRDIEAAIAQQSTAPAPVEASAPTPAAAPAAAPKQEAPAVTPFAYGGNGGNNFEDTPVSQMRKVIARRLGESKFSAPHFYLSMEMNMAKAMSLRVRINEISPTKISFNDLVIKAAAAALRQHPTINSSWMGDFIRVNKDINIGVAVAVPDGLLVPVVKFADIKTLSQINSEVKVMAGKAKDRKLQPDEMTGNTFTISNLGMFGIEEFTAIINPPDACILAVGGIIEKAIVKNGTIEVGHMMKVTLSCDHRVVDGASGAKFLQTFRDIMEDPIRLMV